MPKKNSLAGALKRSESPTASTSDKNKLIGAHFPPEVARQLAIISAESGFTKKQLIAQGLNHVFQEFDKPRIA